MPELIRAMECGVEVEWWAFGLIDEDRWPPGEPHWGMLDTGGTMATITNGASFRSAGNTHTAAARVEAWTEQPSVDGRWEECWEDEITFTSGVLGFAYVTKGVSEETITVSPGTYRLRALSRGREQARIHGDLVPDGVVREYWLFQLWPMAATH